MLHKGYMGRIIDSPQYSGVLPTHTRIDFWECYAQNVLAFIDNEVYGDLTIADRPDLQDVTKSLGVEVTQAISNASQQAEALYALYSEETDEKEKKRLKARIERIGATVHKGFMFGPKVVDSFSLVNDAVIKKLEKLNSGSYRDFDHAHLFVRSDIYADCNMLAEELFTFLDISEEYTKQYERIVVSVPSFNYVFNLKEKDYEQLPFLPIDQRFIAEKARQVVIDAELDLRS